MARRLLVLDTSVLCCLLRVPGKETCGSDDDRWDHERISTLVATEIDKASTLVLPLAAIVETGNHIAQAKTGDRFAAAIRLAEIMISAAEEASPSYSPGRGRRAFQASCVISGMRIRSARSAVRLCFGEGAALEGQAGLDVRGLAPSV